MAIRSLLLAEMPAHDRADTKAREIVLLAGPASYAGSYGATIEIQQPTHTERATPKCCGVEVLARAWGAGGAPIGFGDGSVEWERFRIYNPPILVPDGTKRTVTPNDWRLPYEVDNFREDPVAALREVIAHNIKLVGKLGASVTAGKVGHTTSTFYPDASVESTSVDGYSYVIDLVWATAHDATIGGAADDTDTSGYAASGKTATDYIIIRNFLLYDTSSLPDTDTISAATLSLYVIATLNGDNDADDWVNIFATTPASNTAIVTDDYEQIGTTAQATQIDIGSITAAAYNDWTLNATGLTSISKTGITKFGAREGHDVLNSAYAGAAGTRDQVQFAAADTAGTTQDPKLVVTHAGAETPGFMLVL